MPRLNNRVGWARTHLVKAGLLESAGRGKFCITERGLEVLRRRPDTFDLRFLKQFPEFVEFRNTVRQISEEETEEEATQTPEELLESSYQDLRRKLAQELLSQVMECSPAFFEKLVVDLLVRMGYGGTRKDAGQAVGQSGDGGIDGIIKEDKLGLDAVYPGQRWENSVGRRRSAFTGSLMRSSARAVITTSRFTKDNNYANSIQQPRSYSLMANTQT
jgi:restriction system protein